MTNKWTIDQHSLINECWDFLKRKSGVPEAWTMCIGDPSHWIVVGHFFDAGGHNFQSKEEAVLYIENQWQLYVLRNL